MAAIFSDQDISRLIQERKPLPTDYRTKIQTRPKSGHKERELDVESVAGEDYRLILRQSIFNPISIHLIFQLYWLTDLQIRTSFSVYNDIMEKVMNILILLKGKHSMIFTFTRLQNGIRRLVPGKIPMPNQRIDLLIFSRPLRVCSKIVALRCLSIRRVAFSRRYER
jgi:hypothetical protein